MSGQNGNKSQKKLPECPYCARPDLFEPRELSKWGRGQIVTIRKGGNYWKPLKKELKKWEWLRQFTEYPFEDHVRYHIDGKEHFAAKFQDFDIDVIGMTSDERPPLAQGAPFFFRSGPVMRTYRVLKAQGRVDKPLNWKSYSACRITHRPTDTKVDFHWHQTHGLIAAVRDFPFGKAKKADFLIVETAMSFFRVPMRGNPKIREEYIEAALERLGAEATARAVAKDLGVTEQGLEKWRDRHGMNSWSEVVEEYTPN